MRVAVILAMAVSACLACSAQAVPRRIELAPPGSQVAFRAYGIGLFPIDASFTRFDGWLSYDPDDRRACQVELHVQVASLVTDDPAMRSTIVGPDFMDATAFPALTYIGRCDTDGLAGRLNMHGVDRPFALTISWNADGVVAEGRLLRADWGMTAMPLLAGHTVRIRVAVPLSQEQVSHRSSTP